jgi:hypothetical protein
VNPELSRALWGRIFRGGHKTRDFFTFQTAKAHKTITFPAYTVKYRDQEDDSFFLK